MIDPTKIVITPSMMLKKPVVKYDMAKRIDRKICCVCKQEKHYSQFGINTTRNDGLQTYCTPCAKEKQSEWYYKRVHGITLEERDKLLESQFGQCAICGNMTEFQYKKGKRNNLGEFAVVDHCHSSSKIRGILCGHCNTGLGAFKDNIESLQRAIKYLQESGVN